jgi:hypothetical protein
MACFLGSGRMVKRHADQSHPFKGVQRFVRTG